MKDLFFIKLHKMDYSLLLPIVILSPSNIIFFYFYVS